MNTNEAGLTVLDLLLKFYNFNNNMTIKEVKEEIQEKLWIEQFNVKFRVFKIIDHDEIIGKVTVAMRPYSESSSITENDDLQESIKNNYLKLAFAFCDISRDTFNRKEGERYALHRLLCDEPDVITNTKYTKLDNDFIKNVEAVLPFQAYVEEKESLDEQVNLIKEAIIKSARSMQIVWMNGITEKEIK